MRLADFNLISHAVAAMVHLACESSTINNPIFSATVELALQEVGLGFCSVDGSNEADADGYTGHGFFKGRARNNFQNLLPK